jgi:cytochrome c553
MKKLFLAILALPLIQSGASAQLVGDAAAGKAYWNRKAPRQVDCMDCHGIDADGGFGPDLAGRGLSAAQVLRTVRQPWGIMPAFVESQISDQEAANLAAWFASMPKVAEPEGWNVSVPDGAPPGQVTMITIGCGQCHGETFNGPRANIGLSNMNFDTFQNLVYNHTTAMPAYRASIGNAGTNLDMGNFSRSRLTVGQLRQIYLWARDQIGVRAPMQGQIAKGQPGPSGVTYPITVRNNAMQGGVIAEGLTVSLTLPEGYNVVAATGPGYQGVNQNVATWKLARAAPKDEAKLSVTLSKALTQDANVKGTIKWAKPAPKTGPSTDVVNIAGAPM